jgi:phosphohistidine phosphatase
MKLIIMRHGEAETFGSQDSERCLTPNGIKQAQYAGTWLSQYIGQDKKIDLAVVSPFVRAEQTYFEVVKEVTCQQKQISADITPSGSHQIAHDLIRTIYEQNQKIKSILVVSHMPFVSYFVEEVTINKYAMLFDTSSIVVIDYDLTKMAGLVEQIYHPQ